MGQHNLNINSLAERNAAFMLSTVAHSMGDANVAIMEAKDEAEGDVGDLEILRIPPPLMALRYQTPTALLPHRNGTHLVLDVLLYFSYLKTVKDADLEEAMTLLDVDAAVDNMTMSAILLQLTPTMPLVQKKMRAPTMRILTVVAVMDVVLDVGPIRITTLDSLGHW